MNIADQIKRLNQDIELKHKQIAALHKLAELLPEDVSPTVCGGFIDFNHPPRSQALNLIKKLPGKWNKSTNGGYDGKLDYVNHDFFPGIPLRLYAAEPPPTCKLEEYEETIPAQPEMKLKRTRLVCHEIAA